MNIVGNKRYDINLRYNEKTIEMVDVVYDDGTDEVHHGFAVRLSKKENNGLQFDDEGHLIAIPKTSEDAGMSVYYPGNGIQSPESGTYDPIKIIRCNSAVSRIQSGDPLQTNEGVNTHNLINAILGRLDGDTNE